MNVNVSCSRLVARLAVGLSSLAVGLFPAVADVFTIDPSQSSLTVSGSILGNPFSPQGAGSMTTTYGGTIQAAQTAGTIQFTGLSLITANTNGSWTPLAGGGGYPGVAAADYGATASLYGGFVTVVAAFRSLLFDVTSPAITVTGGQFYPGSLMFLFPSNTTSTLDYTTSALAVAPAHCF